MCALTRDRAKARALLQEQFTHEQRATMGSLVSLAGSLAFAATVLAIGALADRWGVVPALLAVQVMKAVPLILYGSLYRRG